MIHGPVVEGSGDGNFMCFEAKGQVSPRESMAHNFVARPPFLHRCAGRDITEHCDIQRSLAIGWMDRECEVYLSVVVVLLNEVGFPGSCHFVPVVS